MGNQTPTTSADPRVIASLQRCGTVAHNRQSATEQELRAALAMAREQLGACADALASVYDEHNASGVVSDQALHESFLQSCGAAMAEAKINNLLRR